MNKIALLALANLMEKDLLQGTSDIKDPIGLLDIKPIVPNIAGDIVDDPKPKRKRQPWDAKRKRRH